MRDELVETPPHPEFKRSLNSDLSPQAGRGKIGFSAEELVGWQKWIAAAIAVAAAVVIAAYFRPDRAIRVATGLVAHNVCAKVFVSGLDPETVFSETIDRAGVRRLRPLLRFALDRAGKTVDASVAGWLTSRAAFHDGFGCVLLHGAKAPYLLKSDIDALKVAKAPPLLEEIAGAEPVEPSDPALTHESGSTNGTAHTRVTWNSGSPPRLRGASDSCLVPNEGESNAPRSSCLRANERRLTYSTIVA